MIFQKVFVCLILQLIFITVSGQEENGSYQELDTVIVDDGLHNETEFDESGEEVFKLRFHENPRVKLESKSVPDSIKQKFQDDADFWYAQHSFNRQYDSERGKPFFEQQWFRTLVWIIIITSFLGMLIWFLSKGTMAVFRKASIALDNDEEDTLQKDLFSINFEYELSRALQQSDFRLAVRLLYLRLLRDLSIKGVIQYQQGRTNLDYLLQVRGSRYYEDFFRLTRHFEFVWYGKFQVEEGQFRRLKQEFDTLNIKLS